LAVSRQPRPKLRILPGAEMAMSCRRARSLAES